MLMRNMLRTDANRWGKIQERKMTDRIKKIKDIQEDKVKPKRTGEEKNRKYLHFILNFFDHYNVLRSIFDIL